MDIGMEFQILSISCIAVTDDTATAAAANVDIFYQDFMLFIIIIIFYLMFIINWLLCV